MNIQDYISNLTFIDKDFPALYTDILDLAKKLSNDWDPSKSNESDPVIVLIKLATFLADHLNYNIDKNILENFLPTATQETSTRNLVEMNGYNPRYYISASGDVTFVYKPSSDDNKITSAFTIPAYTIILTNDKNNVTYTQAEPLVVLPDKVASTCKFIEGTRVQLYVNGDENIKLENLDDNNRLYLPSKNVAQNGFTVSSTTQINPIEWQEVNYLNTMPLGSYVYRLGYDSNKELPYLEFPSDIATLIGSGLNIYYTVTSGLKGNISANVLTVVQSPSNYTYNVANEKSANMSDFSISNTAGFINGKDPETIDEMYKSFKKIVGTFDTLVTRRDYEDKIRSSELNDEPVVSNCIVTDYLTDYNNSTSVVTLNNYGEYTEHIVKYDNGRLNLLTSEPESPNVGDAWIKDGKLKVVTSVENNNVVIVDTTVSQAFETFIASMTPYDLCVYGLQAYREIFSDSRLNNILSYYPISEGDVETIDTKILSEQKIVNHTIKAPEDGDVILIKNNVPINATIMPYDKVTEEQAKSIIEAATNAIANKYAANNLEFGEELNYDSVLRTILESDDRIKDARLEDFTYTPEVIVKNLEDKTGFNTKQISNYMTDIVAKNILAGKVPMFNVDEMATFPFESANRVSYSNVKTITPSLKITGSSNVIEGSLAENENIHILWPSTTEDVIYPAYIDYTITLNDGKTITENSEYILQDGESLVVKYTSNGTSKSTTYSTGTIIKATFELGVQGALSYIPTGQTISIMKEQSTTVNYANIYCTWNRNNENNILFEGTETEVILGTNEFFAYSNEELTSFIFFGTGTKLTRQFGVDDSNWIGEEKVDQDTISTLKSVWKQMNLSTNPVTCQEMNTLTLGKDYAFNIKLKDGQSSITGDWEEATNVQYKNTTDSDYTVLSGSNYIVKSSLSINCSPSKAQQILTRTPSGDNVYTQSVNILYETTENGEITTKNETIEKKSIIPSIEINMPGDSVIAITVKNLVIDALLTGDDYKTTLDATPLTAINNSYYISADKNSILTAHLSYDASKACIVPVYISTGKITNITIENSSCREYIFGSGTSIGETTGPKLINVYIPSAGTSSYVNNKMIMEISASETNIANIQILAPIVYDGLNKAITSYSYEVEDTSGNKITKTITEQDIINRIKSIIEESSNVNVRPRLKANVQNDNAIQIDNFSDPYILFDINNVVNHYVLPAIDFDNSNIGIYKSMRLLK